MSVGKSCMRHYSFELKQHWIKSGPMTKYRKCVNEGIGPQWRWTVVSHIAWEVNGEKSYIKGFHNTLSMYFLERIDLINKQNWDPCVKYWVESGVVIVILYVFNNFTIKFPKCKMERKYLKIPRLMILKRYHQSKAPMYTY